MNKSAAPLIIMIGLAVALFNTKVCALVIEGNPQRLSDAVIQGAARLALPLALEVPQGSTPRETIQNFCSDPGGSYGAVLKDNWGKLNPMGLGLDEAVASDSQVIIPYCFSAARASLRSVQFKPSDTLWKYWGSFSSAPLIPFSQLTTCSFCAENKASIPIIIADDPMTAALTRLNNDSSWNSFADAFKKANPKSVTAKIIVAAGQTVALPTLPQSLYSLSFDSSAAASEFVTTLAQTDPALLVHPGEPDAGRLEGFVSDADLARWGEDCGSSEAAISQRLPSEMTAIANALIYNNIRRSQLGIAEGRSKARILVADSGLDGPAGNVGTSPFVFGGSVVGATPLEANPSQTRSSSNNPEHSHGTSVATVALGGPLFVWMDAMNRGPIEVRFYRVDQARVDSSGKIAYDIVQSNLSGIGVVEDASVSIVNMSFTFEQPITEFYNAYIKNDSSHLYVIAAGNDGKNLDDYSAWPAQYGGDDSSNVITVGAANWSENLAAFSNYSPSHVDLSAPGCRIATLGFDPDGGGYTIHFESGTSLAAPYVSFAAGLLKAEMPSETLHSIKNRLLYSADILPGLLSKVRDGREVNLVRALSVFSDLVEFSDGTILRGELTLPSGPIEVCSGFSLNTQYLRRIAVVPSQNNRSEVWVYSEQPDGTGNTTLKKHTCKYSDLLFSSILKTNSGSRPITPDHLSNITLSLLHR